MLEGDVSDLHASQDLTFVCGFDFSELRLFVGLTFQSVYFSFCSLLFLCRYSHDGAGGAAQQSYMGQYGSAEKCVDFQRGICTRGASCKFTHSAVVVLFCCGL